MILLVATVGVVSLLVGLLGWWLAVDGPSPGLGMATIGAPLNALQMGACLGLIRLREATSNYTGERQVDKLAEGWALLQNSLAIGSIAAVLCLAVLLATWVRAHRAKQPLTHWGALIPGGILALAHGRVGWAGLALLLAWDGPGTLEDPTLAMQAFVGLMLGMLTLVLQAACALTSLLLGVGLRWRHG